MRRGLDPKNDETADSRHLCTCVRLRVCAYVRMSKQVPKQMTCTHTQYTHISTHTHTVTLGVHQLVSTVLHSCLHRLQHIRERASTRERHGGEDHPVQAVQQVAVDAKRLCVPLHFHAPSMHALTAARKGLCCVISVSLRCKKED
jgi:hypothetical protein